MGRLCVGVAVAVGVGAVAVAACGIVHAAGWRGHRRRRG